MSEDFLLIHCEDCGADYIPSVQHVLYCEARTCEKCMITFGEVLTKDRAGRRVCADCMTLLAEEVGGVQ